MSGNQTSQASQASQDQQDWQGLSAQQHHLANSSGYTPGPCQINLSSQSSNTAAGQQLSSYSAWNQGPSVDDVLAMRSMKNNSGSMHVHKGSQSGR